ncbi:SIR2 family protein [Polyangium sp. 15x6]|uniref:SIR2 family protein n=1 Tax=Polyangium sp. 15x6 TaxID=3042687 RepID=UPI00249C97E6|nr:SIR2 family protein [Polyangium sp. 15x6]MDI3282152.1 SIR2 family protein [Polyangium sp. 15x6]
MSGHLFILHGDLTLLSCDAWLVPCDIDAMPSRSWTRSFSHLQGRSLRWATPTEEWRRGKQRVLKVVEWEDHLPRPWVGNVGAVPSTDVSWFVAGAEEFIERVTDDLRAHGTPPRNGRAKHLLALPVIGTRYGGKRHWTGDVVRALVPVLQRLAIAKDVDIALVSNDELTYASAQAQRGADPSSWPDLDEHLWRTGESLAHVAANGDLVLFIGAGVSKNAGLPDWGGLLRDLARDAGMNEAELGALKELGALDQARAIELRMETSMQPQASKRILGERIADAFARVHGYALSHALLAALPAREVITTNYDTLFERASQAAGMTVSVLPHEPQSGASRWVLKMHGCVTDPDNIVLTREDYMRYDLRRQALAGIVQALLLMRHMLFIGFSLRDDNFHRIADAVRRARVPAKADAPSPVGRFGTALSLFWSPLEQSLWGNDLDWVNMQSTPPPAGRNEESDKAWAEAARRLELFLDSLLARTGTTAYLLHPRFEGALSDTERGLADKLQRFLDEVDRDPSVKSAPAWKHLEALLHRLGWPRTP